MFFGRSFAAFSVLVLGVACSGTASDGSAAGAAGSESLGGSSANGAGAGGAEINSAGANEAGANEGGASGAPDTTPEGGQAGEGGAASAETCASRFATSVVSFTPGAGPTTGQDELPDIVLGPPKGGGTASGSLDVATLGNGGVITLGFAPSSIVDRPGPDFIVFENPFNVGGDPTKPFAELGTVSVSEDGVTWHDFPCTATAYPYGMCAGWHPVLANADTNHIDPTDPAVAGGDDFDLADIGVSEARFVRITDRVDQTGLAGTFDLDAVSIVHAECP